MALVLTSDHIQAIQADAQRAYPDEGCGLLLGTLDRAADRRTLAEVRLLKNAWEPAIAEELAELSADPAQTKSRRYWIDPKAMLAVQKEARSRELSIIGVYHSHPDHAAVPSECDLALAWSDYTYIIVSVQRGRAVEVRCWQLDEERQFQAEPMCVIETADTADGAAGRMSPLSA